MTPKEFLDILHIAERLKCGTRHSYTSSGRHESVAEHSWRISLMAMLLTTAFPEADMNKVIRMCLIHDLGEAVTFLPLTRPKRMKKRKMLPLMPGSGPFRRPPAGSSQPCWRK